MDNQDNELYDFLRNRITKWVGRNYGTQEADDPSWNIEGLAYYLAKQLNRRENRGADTPRDAYELTVLLDKNRNVADSADAISAMVRTYGGRVQSWTDDGVKRLAYAINNEEHARYLYFDIELPNGSATRLSSRLNITDGILRYLLVKKDVRR